MLLQNLDIHDNIDIAWSVAKQLDDFTYEFLHFREIEAIKFIDKIMVVLPCMHITCITYFFKIGKV
jgi:hypothetical protein